MFYESIVSMPAERWLHYVNKNDSQSFCSCLFSALIRCEWEVLHSNRTSSNKVKLVERMCRYTYVQHYGYLQLFYTNIYCFYCLSIFVKYLFFRIVFFVCGKLQSVLISSSKGSLYDHRIQLLLNRIYSKISIW